MEASAQTVANGPISPSRIKKSPVKSRKRQHSPDRSRTASREADPPRFLHGDPRVETLSQLSDILSMTPPRGSPREDGSAQAAANAQPERQHEVQMSQPSQPEPELQPELPSQPDFAAPELGPGPPQESQQQISYAQHAAPLHHSAALEPEQHQQQVQMHMMPVMMQGLDPAYSKQEELATQQQTSGRGSRGSRATRRGPMDEMRQLVRILVKVIPQSAQQIMTSDEGGGGNRISEEQIKSFLENTLGEAPRPAWGVPQGWGGYLSDLFTWVKGSHVSPDQAMRCAKREPGRSWEALQKELHRLDLFPERWHLPLSQATLHSSQGASVPSASDQGQQPPQAGNGLSPVLRDIRLLTATARHQISTNPHWHAETDTHEIVELLKELTLLSRLLGQPTPSFPPTLLHSQPDGIPEGHVLVDSRTAQAMPLREYSQLMECSPNGYLLTQSPSRPIASQPDSQPQVLPSAPPLVLSPAKASPAREAHSPSHGAPQVLRPQALHAQPQQDQAAPQAQQEDGPATTQAAEQPAHSSGTLAIGHGPAQETVHLAAQGLPTLQAHPVQGADGNPSSQFVAIPAALFQKHLEALQASAKPGQDMQYMLVCPNGGGVTMPTAGQSPASALPARSAPQAQETSHSKAGRSATREPTAMEGVESPAVSSPQDFQSQANKHRMSLAAALR